MSPNSFGVSQAMVGKWRRRFVEHRLDGLSDDPRPGVPRTITDDQVEAVIVKTLEEKPDDATHWSTRSMATEVGMSHPLALAVNVVFWVVLAGSLAGLVHRHCDRNVLIALTTITAAGFLSVWVVSTQTSTYEARYVLVGLSATAALAALGLERWKVPLRFVLPAMGLIGTLVEIQQNVLAVHWS